jgi:hypothetical protein
VEWEMGGRGVGDGRACGLQTRIISAGTRLAGSAGKAGRRHFALGLFAPHLQFRNCFLTLPCFCRSVFAGFFLAFLARLEAMILVELLRIHCLVKAEPSVATREPSTMAPKGARWQGPGPF